MILNLLDRMKFPFRRNKEFLTALYNILGFYPHNIEIYRIAFSHKSLAGKYAERNAPAKCGRHGAPALSRAERNRLSRKGARTAEAAESCKPLNNERLEYLGDAVLETVVSDILFHHFDRKREGFLTATRSKIVSRDSLNRIAADLRLDRLIQAAQGTSMRNTNIGGNAFEALMGAIYLDRGFKHCRWFIANRIIGRYLDLDGTAQKEVNFKSKLLEWCQKNRINQSFKMEGDESDKQFRTTIIIEELVAGRGVGHSKKESQQSAAKEALTKLRREPQFIDRIFRNKEKRTAMEADESFALPKIDEIEETLRAVPAKSPARNADKPPVLEDEQGRVTTDYAAFSDDAYDAAYSNDDKSAAAAARESGGREQSPRKGKKERQSAPPADIEGIDFSESSLEFPSRPVTDEEIAEKLARRGLTDESPAEGKRPAERRRQAKPKAEAEVPASKSKREAPAEERAETADAPRREEKAPRKSRKKSAPAASAEAPAEARPAETPEAETAAAVPAGAPEAASPAPLKAEAPVPADEVSPALQNAAPAAVAVEAPAADAAASEVQSEAPKAADEQPARPRPEKPRRERARASVAEAPAAVEAAPDVLPLTRFVDAPAEPIVAEPARLVVEPDFIEIALRAVDVETFAPSPAVGRPAAEPAARRSPAPVAEIAAAVIDAAPVPIEDELPSPLSSPAVLADEAAAPVVETAEIEESPVEPAAAAPSAEQSAPVAAAAKRSRRRGHARPNPGLKSGGAEQA